MGPRFRGDDEGGKLSRRAGAVFGVEWPGAGGESVASVELRGLTKRYGELAVVNDVSLTIEHGRLVCLLGPAGCGKTTTLPLIPRLLPPSAGAIRLGVHAVVPP